VPTLNNDQNFETIISSPQKAPTPEPAVSKPAFKLDLKNKKLRLIGGGILGFFVLLIVLAAVFGKRPTAPLLPRPTPIPSPTPTQMITNPSAYAIDSAVLQIENTLLDVEKDLANTDLRETELNPPVLDLDVNFTNK